MRAGTVAILGIGGILLVSMFGGKDETGKPSDNVGVANRAEAAVGKPSPSALDMMHVAFVGRHSPSEIEAQVRRAAAAFGLPATDENFSRIGSALVVLRKESRVPEMELLRCARAMGEEVAGKNVGLDFPSAASLCAATLMR